jgi:hypothetical protein
MDRLVARTALLSSQRVEIVQSEVHWFIDASGFLSVGGASLAA